MNRLHRLGLVLALTGLGACRSVGPDYRLPDTAAARTPAAQAAVVDAGNPALAANAALPERWWELYQDPTLNALITQALAGNHDLKVAAANLQQAAALHAQALDVAGLKGQADASLQRAQISPQSFLLDGDLPRFTLADTGFTLAYPLDLFGALQRVAEASAADADAVAAARDMAQIAVVAQVAGSYLQVCHANHELHLAEHTLQLQRDALQLSERMLRAGRGTPQQPARARAQLALHQASLPPLHAHRQAALYQIAALLGQASPALPVAVTECQHAPELAQPLPVGDGAALLKRRPDIRQAERRLAAATARIGVAIGALYPDIRLGASIGAAGLLQDMGSSLTRQWSLGPLISWSMPTPGTRARIAASQAGADAALAAFDASVVQALQQTRTALSDYAQRLDRLHTMEQALHQAQQVAALDARLHAAGRAPYSTQLDAGLQMALAESAAADAHAQVARAQIQVFLALGGGWASAPAP